MIKNLNTPGQPIWVSVIGISPLKSVCCSLVVFDHLYSVPHPSAASAESYDSYHEVDESRGSLSAQYQGPKSFFNHLFDTLQPCASANF
jgi:hypothetical protein